jgi:hypothetical protein
VVNCVLFGDVVAPGVGDAAAGGGGVSFAVGDDADGGVVAFSSAATDFVDRRAVCVESRGTSRDDDVIDVFVVDRGIVDERLVEKRSECVVWRRAAAPSTAVRPTTARRSVANASARGANRESIKLPVSEDVFLVRARFLLWMPMTTRGTNSL